MINSSKKPRPRISWGLSIKLYFSWLIVLIIGTVIIDFVAFFIEGFLGLATATSKGASFMVPVFLSWLWSIPSLRLTLSWFAKDIGNEVQKQ